MSEAEIIQLARDHLMTLGPFIHPDPPLVGIEFKLAEEITPYDRWLVVSQVFPGCDPDRAAIEVLPPDMTVRHARMM